MASFWGFLVAKYEHVSHFVVLIVDFEQANVCWIHIEKCKHFQCEQNLLTNSMWTYTITNLRVNQWEILVKEFTSAAHIQDDLLCIWDKVFKSGPSKICGRQPLKFQGCLWQILLGPLLNILSYLSFSLYCSLED